MKCLQLSSVGMADFPLSDWDYKHTFCQNVVSTNKLLLPTPVFS
jgi:hypothetical protein